MGVTHFTTCAYSLSVSVVCATLLMYLVRIHYLRFTNSTLRLRLRSLTLPCRCASTIRFLLISRSVKVKHHNWQRAVNVLIEILGGVAFVDSGAVARMQPRGEILSSRIYLATAIRISVTVTAVYFFFIKFIVAAALCLRVIFV